MDEFFSTRRNGHNIRFIWEQRVGDIFVALKDGELAGFIACAAGHVSKDIAKVVEDDFRQSKRKGRQSPIDKGQIPAVRIVTLAVAFSHQKQGIGSALLEHALSAITAPIYYLFPERDAEKFYEKRGFSLKSTMAMDFMVKIPPARDFYFLRAE